MNMLVMRFFTKICSSEPESLIFRVVMMSMGNLSELECDSPHKKWSASNRIHHQSWTQCMLASAERLGVPKERTKSMQPGLLLIIQEQKQDEHGAEVWMTVPSPTTYVPMWEHGVSNIRLALQEVPSTDYVEGEDAWTVLSSDVTNQGTLLGQLSRPLRLAYHAAIRKAANRRRKALVRAVALEMVKKDSHMQGWASMCGFFSFMPPYWRVHDTVAARAMLRIRMDVAWNEVAVRMRPSTPKRSCTQKRRIYERIQDRNFRACYLCDEIHGQPGMFESESLYHMLIECPNTVLQEWRSDLRKAVVDLSKLETTLAQSEDPPAFNDSEMWAVMLLCMSTKSLPVQQGHMPRLNRPLELLPISEESLVVAKDIRSGKPVHDRQAISAAVKWMEPLTSAWMGVTRNYRGVGVAEAMPGAKLNEIVCKHMRKLFTLHRRLLKGNVDYQERTRDPLFVNAAGSLVEKLELKGRARTFN